jgi:hypothetical protein
VRLGCKLTELEVYVDYNESCWGQEIDGFTNLEKLVVDQVPCHGFAMAIAKIDSLRVVKLNDCSDGAECNIDDEEAVHDSDDTGYEAAFQQGKLRSIDTFDLTSNAGRFTARYLESHF